MIEIINSDTDQKHLEYLNCLFMAEWGKIDSFNSSVSAIDDGELIGGLVFTSYKKPDSDEMGTWINALVVVEEYRRRGIASRLLKAAEIQAADNNESELYAYTDVPELYVNNGWTVVSNDGTHRVLQKKLTF